MTEAATLCGDDIAIISRVADFVIAETTFRLRDLADGRTWETSDGLAPSETVVVDSRFNAWSNRSAMVLDGMKRLGRVLGEEHYTAFPEKCLAFTARHLPYFQKQYDSGFRPPKSGQTPGGGMLFYFAWDELWKTGLAPVWIEKASKEKCAPWLDYTRRFADKVNHWPRTADGLLVDKGSLVIACSSLMAFPAMLRLAKFENSESRREDALNQMFGYHERLFDQRTELYCRVWDDHSKTRQPAHWGRGGGWMALTWADFLEQIPPENPRYGRILAAYRAQMCGLRRWQSEDGGWRQVMDHPGSWIETSCTAMFTCAIARGINEGWLDRSYKAVALAGWKALLTKVSPAGGLVDICPGTVPGDEAHYLGRPRKPDDPHGYGPFLLAAAEVRRLAPKL